MEELETQVKVRETVVLTGDICSENQRRRTRELLEEKWESGTEALDIDFSGVTAVNYDSLTELLMIRNRFLHAETDVGLVNIPKRIKRIMQIFRVPVSGTHGSQYP